MPKKKISKPEDEGPKAKTIYTIKLDDARLEQLGERLDNDPSAIWKFYDVPYSQFAYKPDLNNLSV